MLRGQVVRGVAVVGAAVGLGGGAAPDARGAKNPAEASVKCRKAIGQHVLEAVGAGLKAIQTCHGRQLKSGQAGDCNKLAGSAFDLLQTQAVVRIGLACKDGDPVLANYTPPTVTGGLTPVLDAIQAALEESGAALQGLPGFQGDPQQKAKGKCSNAVGVGRTAIVKTALKGALKCQQGIDKTAQSFGPLDASCVAAAGGVGGKVTGKLAKACTGIGGIEVGSCAGLPGCLVTGAEATAQTIARLTFGGPAVCGNGIKDQGEDCDDGNTVENDGCRANCLLPSCGDLIVNQASEQCDEEDGLSGDAPGENCYQCKLNVCGDGFRDTQEPVIEECDDGNTAAGDGCTNCAVDPVLCDADGLTVDLALDYPPQLLADPAGTTLALTYPGYASIPGSGSDASVRARVTNLLPPGFTFTPSDNDPVLSITGFASSGRIEPQPVASVQFDCAQGTPTRTSDFPCNIADLVDHSGSPFEESLKALAHCVVTLGGVAVSTTTTTSNTVIAPPTTSTTLSASCGNGMVDGTDECDDGNSNPNDGCTNACTLCGNLNITAPETCDDGNNDVNDDCPEDC